MRMEGVPIVRSWSADEGQEAEIESTDPVFSFAFELFDYGVDCRRLACSRHTGDICPAHQLQLRPPVS